MRGFKDRNSKSRNKISLGLTLLLMFIFYVGFIILNPKRIKNKCIEYRTFCIAHDFDNSKCLKFNCKTKVVKRKCDCIIYVWF